MEKTFEDGKKDFSAFLTCMSWVLVDHKDNENTEAWTHGNKVCRHSILSTLYNELFDVYCIYKEAREI